MTIKVARPVVKSTEKLSNRIAKLVRIYKLPDQNSKPVVKKTDAACGEPAKKTNAKSYETYPKKTPKTIVHPFQDTLDF